MVKHMINEGVIDEGSFRYIPSFEEKLKTELLLSFSKTIEYDKEYKITLKKRKERAVMGIKVKFVLSIDDGIEEQTDNE